MARLNKDDLAQMNKHYFQSLEKPRLVEVAANLHQLAIEQWERLEQNSRNSSRPPSSDNPYQTGTENKEDLTRRSKSNQEPEKESTQEKELSSEVAPLLQNQELADSGAGKSHRRGEKRKPGKQPGAEGKWRTKPLVAEEIVPHYPEQCASCNQELEKRKNKPHMGYYVLELKPKKSGFEIICQLHHYHELRCECGHKTKARPGEGYISCVEGRSLDLKLQEYVLVGPMLATLIASLSVRYRMSRVKIQEFLHDWANTELSIGTIDRCIREAGIACAPVVEKLVEELQQSDLLHLDETHWYESGKLYWLWVAINTKTAVFHIGSRCKEELSYLVKETFLGWLITDGYKAYRSHPKRQRCLAHLIRKAISISGAINQKAAKIGKFILKELKELISSIAQGFEKSSSTIALHLSLLKGSCLIGSLDSHKKLKALASEILNDWEAVIAFVNNPELPPTNNEAERALRHAVIGRRISYGTRTSEGSLAYSSLLSVIETCRLRNINPWTYICEVIAKGRKGLPPPPIPTG
jgi:hypothetical protein